MTDRWKNILIGSFVAIAISIGIALVFFLKPTIGDGKNSLQVRFTNIAGINKGTRVTYAGKPIGEVSRIEHIPNARIEAVDEAGRVFSYQLSLRLDSNVSVYNSDEISIRTTGLMGEKSIAILPKAPPIGITPELISDQILYASSTDPFDNMILQIGRVTAKAEQTIERFDDWFKETAPVLSHATRSLGDAAQSLDRTLTAIDQHEIIPSLSNSLALVSNNMRLIHSSLANDELLSRFGNLVTHLNDALYALNTDGAQTLSNLNKITRDLVSGSGTIGRLLKGDDFYLRCNSLMSKSETFMNDINHYGLLFQYNKSWQRSRTKKANQLKALDSPAEFKNYFEGEIDSINTALGRISELLQRADRSKIANNEPFKRDFAQLLRQVQALNDSLKLYNEDLVAKLED